MRTPVLAVFLPFLGAAGILSTGCEERLTPELVRAELDAPSGTVSSESMALVTRDLFMASRATEVENIANVVKLDFSGGDGEGGGEDALDGASDVFCVGGLSSNIASFDACELGDECDGELTIDACVLHVGDPGVDEDARGKLRFKMTNTVDADFDRSELGIEFDNWESSRDDVELNAVQGQIALETSVSTDDSHVEVVFASDVDVNIKRKVRGLFDDGIEERTNLSAGLRFLADENGDSVRGTLEVLAFADVNGARQGSVVVRLEAEGHDFNAADATATAEASLEIEGENGTFACSWSASEEEGGADGVRVTSEGECIDEDGESFTFSGEALAR